MFRVLYGIWPLLLGIVLIMLGNGMHFTLIGLRGDIEGFSATELAIITSGYFLGFLSGARVTPIMIRRVGHIRVFAALGSIYATQAGMGAVYGTQIGLEVNQIALFIAMLFAGALILQYPIGWLSDRVDRRSLICVASIIGAFSCGLGWYADGNLSLLLVAAFLAGGVTTPLYALFLAYTNDTLSVEQMPAASGGLVFTFGLGAILGPLVTGWTMQGIGAYTFWPVLAVTFVAIAVYALYRMTQKASIPVAQTESYLSVTPTSSPVAVEAASVWAAEHAEEIREEDKA